jgi:hypothetical protein
MTDAIMPRCCSQSSAQRSYRLRAMNPSALPGTSWVFPRPFPQRGSPYVDGGEISKIVTPLCWRRLLEVQPGTSCPTG